MAWARAANALAVVLLRQQMPKMRHPAVTVVLAVRPVALKAVVLANQDR